MLAGAYAYGGQIAGSAYFTPAPSQWDAPFGPGEWGPTNTDERHRVVLFGVFDLPFGILERELDDIVTLSEDELADGVRLALRTTHNLAEGAGAASTAATLKLRGQLAGKTVVGILSGGNLDLRDLKRIMHDA